MEPRIRHVEPSDYEAICEIYTFPLVIAGTLQIPFPSAEMWRKRLAESQPESKSLVAELEGKLVGHVSLQPARPTRRVHVASLGIAVRDDFQGRGIGTALAGTAISLADNWLNVLRMELNVFTDNQAAIGLYRKFGFVIEGTHRAFAIRDGEYVDVHSMARLHPHPPQLPAVP